VVIKIVIRPRIKDEIFIKVVTILTKDTSLLIMSCTLFDKLGLLQKLTRKGSKIRVDVIVFDLAVLGFSLGFELPFASKG